MSNLAVVGAQWGDEGKGKIVDLLAPRFAIVARYQGGPNAGHTVVFNGVTHKLHHIPSGIFHAGVRCLVGAGTLIDPERILDEIRRLREGGLALGGRLVLSTRAHVILPLHRALDAAFEGRLGDAAIGTTRRGIGPGYSSKAERWGVRLIDLEHPGEVVARVEQALTAGLADRLRAVGAEVPDLGQLAATAGEWWRALGPFVGDVAGELHEALRAGRPILFEGAQGALLDVDHGTYPFVTSSNTIAGGIPASLGVPPRAVERVLGVVKAYATRVGAGPFPSEQSGALGDRLRDAGGEYGTTTGRPRRCGWFDAVAARYAVRLNGLDGLAVMKLDVLAGLPAVKIAVAYEIDGHRTTSFPVSVRDFARITPVYEELSGWTEPLGAARRPGDLPAAARAYLDRLAELCEAPVAVVSVGADREATISVAPGRIGL